jgi:SAM-dependent methyltransferase
MQDIDTIAPGAVLPAPSSIPTKRELFWLALAERNNPGPFYRRLAERTMLQFPFPLRKQRVLDLGSGPGHFAEGLKSAGADVVALDWNGDHAVAAVERGIGAIRGDATQLPFPDQSFDGVFCSNLLEHVASSTAVMDELERVLAPGGWAWISWTNWYSPWGGHHITPFHYLGPNLGSRVYERLKGPPPKNRIYDGLWPTYIGGVMAETAQRSSLDIIDVVPRYYPSLRCITRVPGVREVITWNCLIMLRKSDPADEVPLGPKPDRYSLRANGRLTLRRVRSLVGNNPAFLPVVLRATPRGTSRQITNRTDLVVEGYPRSGNTFLTAAIRHVAGPDLTVSSHVHTPSQVTLAVRRKVPTAVVIRRPADSVVSLVIASPHVSLGLAIREWIDHYQRLWPLRGDFVIATFEQATNDVGSVIQRLNQQFGTAIPNFVHDQGHLGGAQDLMEADHERYHASDQLSAPWPTASRGAARRRLISELTRPAFGGLLADANNLYEAYVDHR